MATSTVAVIGGGPLGLMALKNLIEDGFDVTLFETRSWVGGLWMPSDDGLISVTENTRFNSSKYRTSISDFPVPEDMDDFPTARQLQRYLESYCDHFNLWPHIRLNNRVERVAMVGEGDAVSYNVHLNRAGASSTETVQPFSKVLLACGSFVKPRMPDLRGIDKFQGKYLHTINFSNPSQFKGQRILTVGLHASAQDVISGLAGYVEKVYASHRSGILMMPRYTADGAVADAQPNLGAWLIMMYLSHFLPSLQTWLLDKLVTKLSHQAFPNILSAWGFHPAPSITVTAPLIADDLYPHLQSALCEPVPSIAEILGPKTIKLTSGRILEDIDAIICCTGYDSHIPVALQPSDLDPYAYPGALPTLYRNIFPLHPNRAVRNSLAFLGQGGGPYPGFVQWEMQGVAISQIWRGKSALPGLEEMQRWRRWYLDWREKTSRKYGAPKTFYTVFVPSADYFGWLEETAGLGVRRRFGFWQRWVGVEAWRLWWRDAELWRSCLGGVMSPAMFRLFDEGKRKVWEGAREQVFVDNERMRRQKRERLKLLGKS